MTLKKKEREMKKTRAGKKKELNEKRTEEKVEAELHSGQLTHASR